MTNLPGSDYFPGIVTNTVAIWPPLGRLSSLIISQMHPPTWEWSSLILV